MMRWEKELFAFFDCKYRLRLGNEVDKFCCSSMPLSMQKCFHSTVILLNSWRRVASSFIREYTILRLDKEFFKVSVTFCSFSIGRDHDLTSWGISDWVFINSSLLSRFPSGATIKLKPYLSNFSLTLAVAELLFDTISTVCPARTILAMMLSMVCVLPVPGGPCITLIWFSKAVATAFCWLALHPNGNINSLGERCLFFCSDGFEQPESLLGAGLLVWLGVWLEGFFE